MRKRRLHRRYGRARQSMTYGVVPPYASFIAHVREIDEDEGRPYLAAGQRYPMELVGEDARVARQLIARDPGVGRYAHKAKYDLTDKQLYAFVKKLSNRFQHGDDVAGDLASSIMSTLGYEWI